jgi:hypothetical protein
MDHAAPGEPYYNAMQHLDMLLPQPCCCHEPCCHPAAILQAPVGTHLAVPPRLHEPQHCPLCCREHQVHLALADAAISCTVLHEACAGHADPWLPLAERAAQQQQQPELMNQLQWQKGRQKQTHDQAYLAAHAPGAKRAVLQHEAAHAAAIRLGHAA